MHGYCHICPLPFGEQGRAVGSFVLPTEGSQLLDRAVEAKLDELFSFDAPLQLHQGIVEGGVSFEGFVEARGSHLHGFLPINTQLVG
jgi:hypothetical protein